MASLTRPGPRARNPRGEGAALGQQIVSAALDVVDDVGGSGLTLRGVARAVGVSAPAIYAHFANVDAVLLAVAERCFADLAEHLTAAADTAAVSDARLRAVSRAYLDYANNRPGRYQVMFGGLWDATAATQRGSVDEVGVAALGHNVMTAFAEAVHAHTGVAATAGADAVVVWVSLHGYAHQRLVARSFPWPPDFTERMLDRVTRQIGP